MVSLGMERKQRMVRASGAWFVHQFFDHCWSGCFLYCQIAVRSSGMGTDLAEEIHPQPQIPSAAFHPTEVARVRATERQHRIGRDGRNQSGCG
jgi:hypothetical protein